MGVPVHIYDASAPAAGEMETGSPGDSWPVNIAYLVSSRPKRDPDTKSQWSEIEEREKKLSSGLHTYKYTCMYILTCLHTQESMDSILSIPGDHEEVKSLE